MEGRKPPKDSKGKITPQFEYQGIMYQVRGKLFLACGYLMDFAQIPNHDVCFWQGHPISVAKAVLPVGGFHDEIWISKRHNFVILQLHTKHQEKYESAPETLTQITTKMSALPGDSYCVTGTMYLVLDVLY